MSRTSTVAHTGRQAVAPATESAVGMADRQYDTYPRWPLFPLYIGAYVAIWGGWVSLGRMSGFGPTEMLPGIVTWTLDLSIVLPLGLEAYAAFSLGVWLTRKHISPSARRFAKWSSLAGLGLGIAGQVTYHALVGLGFETAPLWVVMVVASVPVLTLAAASTLTHELGSGAKRSTPIGQANDSRPTDADQQAEADGENVEHVLSLLGNEAAEESATSTGQKRPVSEEERRQIVAAADSAIAATGRYSERAIARKFRRSRDTINRIITDAREEHPVEYATSAPAADRPEANATTTESAIAA